MINFQNLILTILIIIEYYKITYKENFYYYNFYNLLRNFMTLINDKVIQLICKHINF